jgi:hypothetical protein
MEERERERERGGWQQQRQKEPILKIGHYVLGKTLGTGMRACEKAFSNFLMTCLRLGTFGKVKVAEHELLEGHKVLPLLALFHCFLFSLTLTPRLLSKSSISKRFKASI